MINQVDENEELLGTARDCFHFVTKFFEPINVSAVHIYHSALELSPLSSIVRRLYYHRRRAPLPRVVAGTPNSWDPSMVFPRRCPRFTWSPCGRFFASVLNSEAVEIHDPVSSELLSTLTKPGARLIGEPAYSPDGRSLACLSDTTLIIWDIQTGGVANEIGHAGVTSGALFVWSLDGGTICTTHCQDSIFAVRVFDIASGTIFSPGTLRSQVKPHLWAHSKSFRIMTMRYDGQARIIDISEVVSVLIQVESLCIQSWVERFWIEAFSPTTYQILTLTRGLLRILDVRSSECLLEREGRFESHCFSSDGSLFATSLPTTIHIWKYASGRYTPWREFQIQERTSPHGSHLLFSPTLSSISLFGYAHGVTRVLRLDDPPIVAHPSGHMPFAVLSPLGTYMAAGHEGNSTIAITNPLSQTTSHFIDTDMKIETVALTGNILLVLGSGTVAAWRLTEEGVVDGVLGDKRAGRGDSLWTIPRSSSPSLSTKGQTVTVKQGNHIHIYHAGTGEVLQPAQTSTRRYDRGYSSWDEHRRCEHYPHHCILKAQNTGSEGDWQVSLAALREGWVKDPGGGHRLWIPAEWKASPFDAGWFHNITTLRLDFVNRGTVIIMF